MILGVGIDLIEVQRIREKIDKPLFKARVFSESEISYCESFKKQKYEHYAGRFSAKEAFLKAIGEGWQGKFSFAEIEIINNELGCPQINLLDKAQQVLEEKNITKMHVSISHLKEIATAIVIIE